MVAPTLAALHGTWALKGKQVENLCSPAAVSPNFHRFRRCHCGRNGSIASQSKRCVSKKFHGKTNQMRTSQKTCHMVVSHFCASRKT